MGSNFTSPWSLGFCYISEEIKNPLISFILLDVFLLPKDHSSCYKQVTDGNNQVAYLTYVGILKFFIFLYYLF